MNKIAISVILVQASARWWLDNFYYEVYYVAIILVVVSTEAVSEHYIVLNIVIKKLYKLTLTRKDIRGEY